MPQMQATLDAEIAKTLSDSVSATILRLAHSGSGCVYQRLTAIVSASSSASRAENIPFNVLPQTIANECVCVRACRLACRDE